MSQEGNTLSLYPPSAAPASFPKPPHPTTTMNSSAPQARPAAAVVPADHHSSDDEKHSGGASGGKGGPGGKSRRELPAGAVATLKAWLLSPEHFTHPYPTPQDQIMLMHKTGIDKKQLKNWFTNARRRIWKPMLKKQLEAGKLAAAGGAVIGGGNNLTANSQVGGGMNGGGGMAVAVPPGLGVPQPELSGSQPQHPPPSQQEMYSNFQQAQLQGGDPNQQVQHQQYQQQQQQQQQYQQQNPQQQQYQQQQVQFDQSTGQMQQQQQPMYDQYGNQVYQDPNYNQYQQPPDPTNPQQQQQPQQPPPSSNSSMNNNNANTNNPNPNNNQFPISNSIGSLAPMNPTSSMPSMGSFGKMIKTDSHAVLMELFARDQDLVRQAAGKGGAQVQQAAMGQNQPSLSGINGPAGPPRATNGATAAVSGALLQSSGLSGNLRWANGTASPQASMGQKQHSVTFEKPVPFEGVSSLSMWPHFSSVSSLNNLGGLQGVKSITNLSAADLSSQGNLNKMGNLAQVKSVENMGRGDSFAFLEVFFDDKSGLGSSGHSNGQRGVKRDRDDDDGAIGLSLDGDDAGASLGQGQFNSNKHPDQTPSHAPTPGAPTPAPLPEDGKDNESSGPDGNKLKRAYDDALAARGLIAVRRSCEKLTDLALPAKMQRTLSQEYIRQHNQGQPMGDFFSTNNSAYARNNGSSGQLQQGYNSSSGQLQQGFNGSSGQLQLGYPTPNVSDANGGAPAVTISMPSDPNTANSTSVEVPSSTKCALCNAVNVDTQLRPCGHMFHGRCLKPSLQNATGPPSCPICSTSMQSAILAVPSGAAGSGAEKGRVGGGMNSGAVASDGSIGAGTGA